MKTLRRSHTVVALLATALTWTMLTACANDGGDESGTPGDEHTSGPGDGDGDGDSDGAGDSDGGGDGDGDTDGDTDTDTDTDGDSDGDGDGDSDGDGDGDRPPGCYGQEGISLIPADRRADWTHAGVRGGIPDVATKVELEGGQMNIADIQEAIDTVPTPGAVLLPAGTFELHGSLTLRSGVVLRGHGLDQTHLRFDTQGSWGGAIEIEGSAGEMVAVTGGFEICSQSLTLESSEGLQVGDSAIIVQDNDPELMETDRPADWNPDWAADSIGQVVEITAVAGDTVEIDAPLRFDYRAEQNPRLWRIDPVTDVGIEDMHVRLLNDAENSVVVMTRAKNSWIQGCELEMTTRAHLWAEQSRFITVENNYVHHAFDYGNGGHGYGITFGHVTSDSLAQNNAFDSLRHALMLKEGANGNVLAYNSVSNGQHDLQTDISVHGHYPYANLIEGNDVGSVANCDWWGPSGPRMTMLRNRNRYKWFRPAEDRSHYANAVGNTVPSGEVFDTTHEWKALYLLLEGNWIDGMMVWDTLPEDSKIETSLVYLNGKPEFWGDRDWPGIGADVDQGAMADIPAMDWFQAIEAAGHGIPFAP